MFRRSTIKCQEKQDNAWCSSVETNLIPLFQLKSCHPSGNLEGPTNIAGGAPQADRPVLQIWRVDVTAPTISAISRSSKNCELIGSSWSRWEAAD